MSVMTSLRFCIFISERELSGDDDAVNVELQMGRRAYGGGRKGQVDMERTTNLIQPE